MADAVQHRAAELRGVQRDLHGAHGDSVKHSTTLSPAGEEMRARAESILYRRFKVLIDRSKRRALTAAERQEIATLEESLGELHAMERHPRRSPLTAP